MKGKASDICSKCKRCEGLDIFAMCYDCKHYNNYPDAAIGVDCEIDCCNFESEEEYNELKKSHDSWRDRYYELRYALRKDETIDESVSCIRDIPSDVEMIEDLKKRAADSDYYKEKSELLEERNNNQYNTIREKDRKISEMEEKLKKANEPNQTISDQEITIKALLITIKEMCKDE